MQVHIRIDLEKDDECYRVTTPSISDGIGLNHRPAAVELYWSRGCNELHLRRTPWTNSFVMVDLYFPSRKGMG